VTTTRPDAASGSVSGSISGIGLGHRPELAGDLLAAPSTVDFVEVVAEACLANAAARREALAIRAVWPVALHGVKLSLGSADGIRDDHARRIGALARELNAPVVSEHVSFTRGGDREIGHLTRLPYTRAAIAVLARNVAATRRRLPDVPLLLENTAATLTWPDDEFDEPDFYARVVAATGCDLLLDVGNLYANAVNAGRDPHVELARFPLDRVAMMHVAGGAWEDGFYFDTHSDPIAAEVLALVADAIARIGAVPILLERDAGFGPFAVLADEVARLRAIHGTASTRVARDAAPPPPVADVDARALELDQRALAEALVGIAAPPPSIDDRFGAAAVARTRTILQRKRIDDALPHLPRLLGTGEAARTIAAQALAARPRARERASLTDAWRIVEAALQDRELDEAAELDALVLRARFLAPRGDESVRPRRAPFVGHVRAARRSVWALKGPGSTAKVHLLHRPLTPTREP
jgi:uncharacterized protein (UPF0276 family)